MHIDRPERKAAVAKTLIKGGYIITMDDELGDLTCGDLLIEGRDIVAVGQDLEADGADVIDGSRRVVLPGLIDGHRHMYSGLVRGCGASTPTFKGYFDDVILTYGANFTPEDTYISVFLGAVESVDAGVTTLHGWEHNLLTPAHADAALKALRDSGLRGRFSYGAPNDTNVVDLPDVARMKKEMFTEQDAGLSFTDDGRVHLGIASRAVQLFMEETWREELSFGRQEGIPPTAHVSGDCIDALAREDQLGPDLFAIHAHHSNDTHWQLLADSDTPICAAPIALGRGGVGRPPIVELMQAGVRLSLSIDSLAGSDSSDMFAVMRMALCFERALHEDPDVYHPRDALTQATMGGADALGIGEMTGSLTPGKRADVIVVRGDDLNMAPLNVPDAQIVLCAQPSNVDTVFIDGICRKRDGKLVGVDPALIVARAEEAVSKLSERIGRAVV
jgi:5-methylthioadenosine/S-adenosylhomocysteine deaminase